MSFNRNLVEFIGITPIPNKKFTNIKVLQIQKILVLPNEYLDIEKLTKISVKADIFKTKLFKSAVGTNLSGQKLSGQKFLIDALLKLKVQYITNDNKNIQVINRIIPFISSIVIANDILESEQVSTSIYIEDIFFDILTPRKLFIQVSLFINCD